MVRALLVILSLWICAVGVEMRDREDVDDDDRRFGDLDSRRSVENGVYGCRSNLTSPDQKLYYGVVYFTFRGVMEADFLVRGLLHQLNPSIRTAIVIVCDVWLLQCQVLPTLNITASSTAILHR